MNASLGYRLLADAVLLIHFAFVAFVVFGQLAILLGLWLRWPFARSFAFRVCHMLAIGVVAIEAIAGVTCPLTTLETELRIRGGGVGYPGDFIAYWADQLLFYDAPPGVLPTLHVLFALLVIGTFIAAPPRRKRSGMPDTQTASPLQESGKH